AEFFNRSFETSRVARYARSRSFRDSQGAWHVARGKKRRHGSFMVYTTALLSALFIAAFPSEVVLAQNPPAIQWQSPAQFHQILKKPIRGTLLFDNDGMEFKSQKFSQRWVYSEI